MELTADQTNALHKRGVVKLEGVIAVEAAARAREMILALARQHNVYSDAGWISQASRFGYPKAFRNALNSVIRSDAFPALIDKSIEFLIGGYIGHPVTMLPPGPQILFSLPCSQDWSVPSDVWHLDWPRHGRPESPGLQAFTFIDTVVAKGGGTLVVAGSHRLCNDAGHLPSKKVKQRLRQIDYFRNLFDGEGPAPTDLSATKGYAGEIELEIVELAGRPGDLYLMDLRAMHTPAPNGSDIARMMLTCRFPRSDLAESLLNAETG